MKKIYNKTQNTKKEIKILLLFLPFKLKNPLLLRLKIIKLQNVTKTKKEEEAQVIIIYKLQD